MSEINDPWDWYAYQDVGRDRLTNYLRDDHQPGEMIRALLSPFRDIEYLHHQLFDMLNIHRATGRGLDSFGELVKIARLGRSDDEYRLAILARRFSSGGSGTPTEIKRAIRNIAVGVNIKLVNHYPAAFIAQIRGNSDGLNATMSPLIGSMADAGVHGYETHDYGKGGFVLSGVAGILYNALGVGPTASGNDDTAMGVNAAERDAPAPADIVAPAAGTMPMTMIVNGLLYKTGNQAAAITLTVGQTVSADVSREDNTASAPSITTAPTAATATASVLDDSIAITAVAVGVTHIVLTATGGDTLFIAVNVAANDVLGVNSAYATLGGTLLAGVNPGTEQPDASYFGTYPEDDA